MAEERLPFFTFLLAGHLFGEVITLGFIRSVLCGAAAESDLAVPFVYSARLSRSLAAASRGGQDIFCPGA